MSSATPLDDLRREIDAIDAQLHELLMRRTGIVAAIGERKRNAGETALRPGREATILRRLVGRHRGPFPGAALARIWRELLSAQTALQGRFAVAVYEPGPAIGYWDLARDHFGSQTTLAAFGSIAQVIRAVAEGEATVGVLPAPQERGPEAWWRALASTDAATPRVVARLPFASRGNGRGAGNALVIARVAVEETGADRSLVVVETVGDTSRARLCRLLDEAGLACTFFTADDDGHGGVVTLIEIEGFVAPDDTRLARFAALANGAVARTVAIGSYAIPLTAAELGEVEVSRG
jgi:chorismate mutase-like protein